MPQIEVSGLYKTFKVARRTSGLRQAAKSLFYRKYDTVEALKDVSFTVDTGEIVGYIGPNGAGKSTTIKIMSGILVPDSGRCTIMGRVPWKERIPHVRNIGVVFGQRTQLWWDVPVIDSYELLRDIYKIPRKDYLNNLDLLICTLELKDIINTPVRQLSLGQRMRCELGASLLHNPKILFLDESTIGLDAGSKIAVRQFIKTINREKNVTVILTTHDMSDIEALANRILLIGRGQILYDGNLDDLKGRFSTRKTIVINYRGYSFPIDDKTISIPGISVVSCSQQKLTLRVDGNGSMLADVISRLSDIIDIVDVSIESQPIDEIILKLYKEYAV
ncbi:MAG: ATP-binding cassette domain-containing protein [Clostridiales bacterium]|jgi:ABC-2 type transport system ATP-binding protein|nr:ATP-binding cassette domain-containing protein [Clostridiales bacterium]